MKHAIISNLIALMTLTASIGCTSYNRPVTLDQLKDASDGPSGGFALTLIPESAATNKIRSYVEISLRDRDKKETIVRIEAPEITAKNTPNGAPFTFKIKPGRYIVSQFTIRTYEQMINGVKYDAGRAPLVPHKTVMFEVAENKVVHIGTFSYILNAEQFAHGFRIKGDLKLAHDKPHQELWAPTLQTLTNHQLTYLAPKESWLEPVTWQ